MAKQEGIQPCVTFAPGYTPLTTSRNVLWKLLIFALLVAVAPIATYFSTLHYFWKGDYRIGCQDMD